MTQKCGPLRPQALIGTPEQRVTHYSACLDVAVSFIRYGHKMHLGTFLSNLNASRIAVFR